MKQLKYLSVFVMVLALLFLSACATTSTRESTDQYVDNSGAITSFTIPNTWAFMLF
jgi:hypothetical protein